MTRYSITEPDAEMLHFIIHNFVPQLRYTTEDGPDEVYERLYESHSYRITSHWFPANEHLETILELSVTMRSNNNKPPFHAYLYRPGTGNDEFPEYMNWRVHVVRHATP